MHQRENSYNLRCLKADRDKLAKSTFLYGCAIQTNARIQTSSVRRSPAKRCVSKRQADRLLCKVSGPRAFQ